MQRTLKLYKLPDQPKTPGFRKLTVADVPKAHKLLKEVKHNLFFYISVTVTLISNMNICL